MQAHILSDAKSVDPNPDLKLNGSKMMCWLGLRIRSDHVNGIPLPLLRSVKTKNPSPSFFRLDGTQHRSPTAPKYSLSPSVILSLLLVLLVFVGFSSYCRRDDMSSLGRIPGSRHKFNRFPQKGLSSRY